MGGGQIATDTWVENGVIYKTRGPEVIAFIETFCLNPKTEKLIVLDDDQKAFLNEWYLMYWDAEESQWFYVYKTALRGEPRGMGKSTLAAGTSLFELSPLSGNKAPNVQLASATRDNTKYVYGPARSMIDLNPAFEREFRMFANKNLIWCEKNRGELIKLSSEGQGNFGGEPIYIVRDELHTWTTEAQVVLSEALMTSLGKTLINARALTTSTAGSDKNTLLGKLYDEMMKSPLLEQVSPGLRVVRDRERQSLAWWWEAPSDLPVEDEKTWLTCNRPARKNIRQLRAIYNDPNTTQDDFRRQYLNQWTKSEGAWFKVGVWRDLKSEIVIPEGARVQCAVDGGWSDDTTAIVWAWAQDEESPVAVGAHVWAYNPAHRGMDNHHTFVEGGTMNYDLVEDFVENNLAVRFELTEGSYDPRYFAPAAQSLIKKGFPFVEFPTQGEQMQVATNLFYSLVMSGGITHDGNPVLAEHVESVKGEKLERGWQISKRKHSRKIDAAVAAIMAVSRAKADLQLRNRSYIFARTTNKETNETVLKTA